MSILTILAANLTDHVRFVASLLIVVLVLAAWRSCFTVRYPANLPLIGEPEGARRFRWRTRLRYYTDCAGLYNEAYEQVGVLGDMLRVERLPIADFVLGA